MLFGKKLLENGSVKWDREAKGRHLHAIQNKVDTLRKERGTREEIVMTILRIGHSNLNST